MIKKIRGQSLIEALFVVVFTTIIMFAFLQICIIAVDDMTANEAAFVAMRSAAVTSGSGTTKMNEAKRRIKNYLFIFYPFTISEGTSHMFGSFGLSDAATVGHFFGRQNENENNNEEETVDSEESDNFVTMHKPTAANRKASDYSNGTVTDHTVKIYYFTRVVFGSLVAKATSRRETSDIILGKSGSRRYQSARSRMVPSPDPAYYNKAYPGARNFEDVE